MSASLVGVKRKIVAEDQTEWVTWLIAAQQGDRRAYAALLTAAVPWLRRRARGRWPQMSGADIEDIVQETLFALHRSLDLYQPPRPVAPFLFGIMKLRGADVRRQRVRHAMREANLDDLPVTSPAMATNAIQEAALDHAAMREAMATLSQRDREILDMMKMREMSLQEASAHSGLSIATLKVGTFRAIKRLRRAMGVDDAP